MKKILFVFSNKTHFETALPLINFLKEEYEFLAIFNFVDVKYSKGLDEYLNKYENLFKEVFVIDKNDIFSKHIVNYLKLKRILRDWIKKYDIISSLQFIEGGYIDWLVIGVLKEHKIKTVVLQWAITGVPEFYKTYQNSFKIVIKKFLKKVLNINYPTMKYLGDGNADYLLTMGEFWTKQFLKHHNYPHKFITTGNPRFLELTTLKNYKKDKVLFVTGAATSLYSYAKEKHLQDIEEVYIAYKKSGIKNIFIHKTHPRDIYVEDIKKLADKYNILLETQKTTSEILKDVYLTIVIRSTVGFEALISGSKLVVYNNGNQTFGFNFADHNLAKETKNIDELSIFLKNLHTLNYPENIEYFIKTENILEDIKNVIESK